MAARSGTDLADPRVVAAGDIACDPLDADFNGGKGTATRCRMEATSSVAMGIAPDAVLTLGDEQYVNGRLAKFRRSYDLTWGRLRPITSPTPGNHEYETKGAWGYFNYFGAAAGRRSMGYYSYDLGSWHVLALNSNCEAVGGCGPDSPQETWLEQDLANHRSACTLAYDHHPRFSSGLHGNTAELDALYRDLYEAGAEILLSGHDHDYERFLRQDPSGARDRAHGVVQFVVGTGGMELRPFGPVQPNSAARGSDAFGVLELALHESSYEWRFEPVPGATFTDSGSRSCHGGPGA